MTTWAYRIMRMKFEYGPGIPPEFSEYTYGVVECHFDRKDKPEGWTDFVKPMGESPAEVVESLFWMIRGAWAGAMDQEKMRERILASRAKKSKSVEEKFYNSEEFKEIMAKDPLPVEEVPIPDPITILVRRSTEGHYLGQEVTTERPRTFEVDTYDEIVEKAKQMIWDGLESTARPEINLCFAWERLILPFPPKSRRDFGLTEQVILAKDVQKGDLVQLDAEWFRVIGIEPWEDDMVLLNLKGEIDHKVKLNAKVLVARNAHPHSHRH